jgi:stage II sporulation protein R
MALVLLLSACAPTPFRLHVVANSDSDEDQAVKMQVRDAVLEATKSGILKCKNAQDAQEYIVDNLEIIEKTAKETLTENGFDYTVSAQVGTFPFPEKTYQGVTYPEGDYQALEVTLGKGEGHNWWCVMFPPLCLTEIETLDEDMTEVEYTSFFAELLEDLFNKSR